MLKSLSYSHKNPTKHHIVRAFIILILIFAISYFVYFIGGTEAAFTHLMYIPIILSAFYFETIGAIVAALVGGLALGPLMPKDVLLGLMQEPISWIFRLIIFIIIGIIIAVLFKYVKNLRETEIERSYRNVLTGLPNMNKLNLDLEEIVNNKIEFSLIGFRIINLDDINRYVDYEIGIKSIKKAVETLSSCVNSTVYSIFTNEFAAVLLNSSTENTYSIAMQFLNKICEPLLIDKFNIELIIKGGIVNFPQQAENPYDLIRKMGIALDQGTNETGLYVYDTVINQKSQEKYEIIHSLFNAIKNEEFYIVYQPKKSLADSSVIGVEALLRWDHGIKRQINTGEFIKIAENIGIISEITKWVIKNVVNQIKKWQNEGISIKVALNISAKDLRDNSVIDYLVESIKESTLEPSMIEIELTERGILENADNVIRLFNILKEQGVKISLDDFGTGYNSLIDLVEIPIDYLKIDKIFIDKMSNDINKILIENIISFAHKTGKKVIAEGVENKKQSDMLRDMGCDYIQGYYFSKPLPPDEIINICYK